MLSRKSIGVTIVLLFSLAMSTFASLAASVGFSGTLTTSSSPVTVSWCSGLSDVMEVVPFSVSVTGVYSLTGLTASSNFFAQVNLTPDNSYTPHINADTYGVSPVAASPSNTLTTGVTYYFVGVSACSRFPLTYSVTLSGPGTINVPGAAPAVAATSNAASRPDSRINWQHGDLNAVLYSLVDGFAVYCHIDGSSWLGMHVNEDILATLDSDSAQDVPVLAYNENGCNVAFYLLDSGEYQVNILTNEGKLYEIIADNLRFENPTLRDVEFVN